VPVAEQLRTDAARNRQALIAAARKVFGQHGLDAPLDEIARTAGVGNATLYRRFPTRAHLVAAVFADRLRDHVALIATAMDDPDPWRGFSSYVAAACRMQAQDRGLADLVTMRVVGVPELEGLQASSYDGFVELVRRAKDAGTLRADFEPEDLVMLLMANAGLVERAHRSARDASARLAHIALDGFRVDASTPAPPAPSRGRMAAAMRKNANRSGLATGSNLDRIALLHSV
jgi:AcrR family transcriptional regulator